MSGIGGLAGPLHFGGFGGAGGSLDEPEDGGDLAFKQGEVEIEDGAAGVENDVDRGAKQVEMSADRLAHAALDPVAVDCLAQNLAHGEADA